MHFWTVRELGQDEVEDSVREDVDKDVARAMWWWSTSETDAAAKQRALRRVLLHTLRGHPTWYFQGMHDLASVLLLALGETGAAAALAHLATHQLRRWVAPGLAPVVDIIGSVLPLVRCADPALFRALDRSGVLPLFCVGWVLTWFTHDVEDPQAAYVLLDSVICCGGSGSAEDDAEKEEEISSRAAEQLVVYMCAALVLLVRDDVLACACEQSAYHFFFTSQMPPLVCTPEPLTAAGQRRRAHTRCAAAHTRAVDPRVLVARAHALAAAVPWARVQQSRREYGRTALGEPAPDAAHAPQKPARHGLAASRLLPAAMAGCAVVAAAAFAVAYHLK